MMGRKITNGNYSDKWVGKTLKPFQKKYVKILLVNYS